MCLLNAVKLQDAPLIDLDSEWEPPAAASQSHDPMSLLVEPLPDRSIRGIARAAPQASGHAIESQGSGNPFSASGKPEFGNPFAAQPGKSADSKGSRKADDSFMDDLLDF